MVSPQEFAFALELSGQGAPLALLADLAAQVCRHVGCEAVPEQELAAALTKATASGNAFGARRCDVQFLAKRNRLEIVVSSNGGRIWQTACAIP